MKYTTPEFEMNLIETKDVITASGTVTVSDDGKTSNVEAAADNILNQIFGIGQ